MDRNSSTNNYRENNDPTHEVDQDHESLLTLSLSIGSRPPSSYPLPQSQQSLPVVQSPAIPLQLFMVPSPPPPPPPQAPPALVILPPQTLNRPSQDSGTTASPRPAPRIRRSPQTTIGQGKTETVPAPYPWATDRRATVHSLQYLLSNGMNTISGQVQCKRCDQQYEVDYDLQQKFMEVASFISENKSTMHDRAPAVWMNPTLPGCKLCNQGNCLKPIIWKKRSINWLFLLLGQMLGCCKLAELKYFCKHTKNHRTGAKDSALSYLFRALQAIGS